MRGPANALIGALLLAGCAARVPVMQDGPGLAHADDGVKRVAFVSTRRLGDDGAYTDRRGGLSSGHCDVRVDGTWTKLERVVAGDLSRVVGRAATGGDVVLYVHGYNEGFPKSCRRAALLQDQLSLDGRLILFSWPANENVLTYEEDIRDLDDSLGQLTRTLELISASAGRRNVTLIGHSLGARGLVNSLPKLAAREAPFRRLILVAPDLSEQRFSGQLTTLRAHVSDIVVYVSSSDLALLLSRTYSGERRLGQARSIRSDRGRVTEGAPEGVPEGAPEGVPEGVTIVDIGSARGPGVMGHVYHLRSDVVIRDLRRVLETADVPSDRVRVSGGYWRLTPAPGENP